MTLNEVQNQIIEEFCQFDEWLDRYEYLIELGKDLEIIDTKKKTPENLIQGCQSRVWLDCEASEEGLLSFKADSDAIITKGIIALLIRVFNNRNAQEIINAELYFIDKTGLQANLSPTRANGLVAMIKQIKFYAIAYSAKKQQL